VFAIQYTAYWSEPLKTGAKFQFYRIFVKKIQISKFCVCHFLTIAKIHLLWEHISTLNSSLLTLFVRCVFFLKKSNQSDTYGCYTDPEESFVGGLPWFDERLSNTQCSIKNHSNNWRLNADGGIRTSARWGRIDQCAKHANHYTNDGMKRRFLKILYFKIFQFNPYYYFLSYNNP
jgi:hypothetical protein